MKRLVRKKERARTDRLKVANNKYTADRGGPESRALQSPSKWVFHTGRKDRSFYYLGEISLENIKWGSAGKSAPVICPGSPSVIFLPRFASFLDTRGGQEFHVRFPSKLS